MVAELNAAARARLAWRLAHGGKVCYGCKALLPVSAFGHDSRAPDGLRPYCNKCTSTANRAAYERRKSTSED